MGLVTGTKIIKREDVLSKVDEATIFGYYFGPFSLRKSYHSVFRPDSNPSTGFYINKNGKLIYNDLMTSEKLDCFAFVAKLHNINYFEAVQKVACDFGIEDCNTEPINIEKLKTMLELSEEVKKETEIEIQYSKWDYAALQYWNDYYITEKELDENNVYNVSKLRINGTFIPNLKANLRFAFIINYNGKVYKKIYEPHAERENKWLSNVPLYLPFGYGDLSFATNSLIITKGQKDRIIFKKYFKDVLALQNESQSSLRDVTLEFLKKKYENIYLFFDIDKAGLENAEKYEEKGLIPIYLPSSVLKHGVKDSSDFVKHYGLKKFERFLSYNKLI